ncbi:MAG: lipopolysaccharide biosynthesis protein [Gemmatimonadota bacterium]
MREPLTTAVTGEMALPEVAVAGEAKTPTEDASTVAGVASLDRSFMRSLAWTGGAKWTGQIVAWGCTIVVARILSPEDYGIVGLANVFLGLVTLLSEFGIGGAVIAMRKLSGDQVQQLNTVAVASGIACFALTSALAIPLSIFFDHPELAAVVVVLSTGFVIAGFRTVPDAILQKDLDFRRLALIEAVQALLLAAGTLTFAFLGFRYWTLVLATLIGSLYATVVAVSMRPYGFTRPNLSSIREALTFGRQLVVTRLAWYTYSNADFLVVGRILGARALGYYNIAWSLASVPVGKISTLLLRVTPAYFSAVQDNPAQLRRYLLSGTEGLALLTFPAALALALVADDFVPLVMGPQWIDAVAPLRLLAIYASLRSITPLLPQILSVRGDNRYNMRNTVLGAIVLPVAFVIGARWGTVGIAVSWMVVHPFLLLPVFLRVCKRIDLRAMDYASALGPAMVGCLCLAAIVLGVRALMPENGSLAVRFAVESAAGAAAYAGVILFLYRDRLKAFQTMARGL